MDLETDHAVHRQPRGKEEQHAEGVPSEEAVSRFSQLRSYQQSNAACCSCSPQPAQPPAEGRCRQTKQCHQLPHAEQRAQLVGDACQGGSRLSSLIDGHKGVEARAQPLDGPGREPQDDSAQEHAELVAASCEQEPGEGRWDRKDAREADEGSQAQEDPGQDRSSSAGLPGQRDECDEGDAAGLKVVAPADTG